jgi:type II secretory pathway component PulK
MWSFRAAVLRFWCVEDGRADPERRTLIDGNGVMIHGIDRSAGPGTKMVSTRECFDLLLAEAEKNPEADVVEILRMIDTLQASNGSVQ